MDNLWIIYGSGWWLNHPSEKYESYSKYLEKYNMFQTTNQRWMRTGGTPMTQETSISHLKHDMGEPNYPLVLTHIANWKITMFTGTTHYAWPF